MLYRRRSSLDISLKLTKLSSCKPLIIKWRGCRRIKTPRALNLIHADISICRLLHKLFKNKNKKEKRTRQKSWAAANWSEPFLLLFAILLFLMMKSLLEKARAHYTIPAMIKREKICPRVKVYSASHGKQPRNDKRFKNSNLPGYRRGKKGTNTLDTGGSRTHASVHPAVFESTEGKEWERGKRTEPKQRRRAPDRWVGVRRWKTIPLDRSDDKSSSPGAILSSLKLFMNDCRTKWQMVGGDNWKCRDKV